jgi:hypothetical protein
LSTVAAVVRERVAKRKATATAREKLTLAQVAKIETWIAIQRKAWLPVDDVAKFVGDLGSAIRKIVLTIHLLAPNVVGLSVADAEARLKEVEDDILQNLHLIDERIKAASNESEENSQPTGERILRGRQTEDEPTNQIR